MYRQDLEKKKSLLTLSKRQSDILVGTLLGDGHLETQNQGRTYRLKIEHTLAQKDYVDWLYAQWKAWVETPPRMRIRNVDFGNGKGEYAQYGFQTLSSGSLRFFAQQFYSGKTKVVPKQIRRWLTPITLAIWFMDDGSIKSNAHRAILLNTQGFSTKDVERLQKALLDRWGIKTSLRKQENGFQIYVGHESIGKFFSTIFPHILPSMRYKIPRTYMVNTIALMVTEAFTKVSYPPMEMAEVLQSDKLASLRDQQVEQMRKQEIVIRPYEIGRRKLNG